MCASRERARTGAAAQGAVAGGVHSSEPRCGQGEEDGGMGGYRRVDALAALKAGPDEVAGIPPVNGGTRGALELAARATCLEHDAVGP